MRVIWLQPWAWAGLASLAAPILIHLLARHRRRELAFPTLRFVRATPLAAIKRRVLSDVPLLAIRLLILAAAVAALAAPVFVSAARQRTWSERIARAIVTVNTSSATGPDQQMQTVIDGERAAAFAVHIFSSSTNTASAIADAIGWLDRQPPSTRELVVVGDLREGTMSAADVAHVPAATGLRFLPTTSRELTRTVELAGVAAIDGRTTARSMIATLDDDRTGVMYAAANRSIADLVTVHAAPGEESMATAVRDAVLAEGIRLPRDGDRRLSIAFEGAASTGGENTPPPMAWMRATLAHLDGVRGGERDGRLVIHVGMRAADPEAVHLVDRIVRTAWSDPLEALEPRRIPPATLASWSHQPSGIPIDTAPGNEGDARWLWLLALGLLALEGWIRRDVRRAVDRVSTPEREVRVA